jgi:Protein of unknown function (DUF3574)
MRALNASLVTTFAVGLFTGGAVVSSGDARPLVKDPTCQASAASQVRTTLYFGLGKPKGMVSELEWQLFLRDEVTPRFPQGLTVWDAAGQWQSKGEIGHERTKVLLLVHPDARAAHDAVQAVIARYRALFQQESVLWETARVCAAA